MAQQSNTQLCLVRNNWNEQARALVGRRIVEARYLTQEECQQQGWGSSGLLMVFDDGTVAFPMADDEGNSPGSLMVLDQFGGATAIPTLPLRALNERLN
jgi:hypothetical protein